MKHKRRCLEKKAYRTMNDVWQKIVSNYLKGYNSLGYYECPVCFDFHLTSKMGDMRTWEVKKKCITASLGMWFKNRKPVSVLLQGRYQRMYDLLGIERPEREQKRLEIIERRRINEERRKVWELNKWTKKNSTLPLAAQRQALAELQKKSPR